MKYKYLKGSEKDFEGAPDWAMVAIKCDGFDNIDFATSLKNGERCHYPNEGIDNFISYAEMWQLIAERQPITESSWDGAGLPPVGCECEIKRVADWMPVTIKFISRHNTVFTTFGGTEDCYQTCSLQFRPIRSEADKKSDAVIEFITGAIDSHGVDPLNSARFIYDAIATGKIPGVRLED